MVVNKNLALTLVLLRMKNRKNIASMASTSRNFRRVADNNPIKRAIISNYITSQDSNV